MKKKSQLCKLEKVIQEQRDLEMRYGFHTLYLVGQVTKLCILLFDLRSLSFFRNLEQRAMNTLVVTACKKLLVIIFYFLFNASIHF